MQYLKTLSRRKFMKTLLMASSAAALDWTGWKALADNIPEKGRCPVVVIGAGLGGLVSAAYLAKYGFDVTLLEQHHIPGGYATAFTRMKGKYRFDVSLHATVAEHAMPQMILKDLGVWQNLNVVSTPELRRIITPDLDLTLPAKNPEGVVSALVRHFPHEEDGIRNFYAEMQEVIAGLWHRKKSALAVMDGLEKITLDQWMDRHVSDARLKQCLAIFSGYYGLPPSKLNALFYAIATGEFLVHGGQYYKSRSQDLSDTLAKAIEDNNGKIHFRKKVRRILFDRNNTIRAVKDSEGNTYPAKAVIANCSVPMLVNDMLPQTVVPPAYRSDLNKRNISKSSFIVWLGLKTDITRHVQSYEVDLCQSANNREIQPPSGSQPGDAGLSVTLYDNLFKGYSRPGTSTMSIMCLSDFEPWREFETDYLNGRKNAYRLEKKRLAARLIKRVEQQLIPGLGDMIEVMEIATPLTNMRYTGNPQGAIYGYDRVHDRDMTHLKATTPIKGLYLAGAWSNGGGYTPAMMSGRQAANALLQAYQA